MELKVRPFGFPKQPYLLHSVQMAVTGDFLKKMSAISPPESLFRIFHFLVVFLFFHHAPPCNKLGALKWSLTWFMWSPNDGGGSIRPKGRSRGAEPLRLANSRLPCMSCPVTEKQPLRTFSRDRRLHGPILKTCSNQRNASCRAVNIQPHKAPRRSLYSPPWRSLCSSSQPLR